MEKKKFVEAGKIVNTHGIAGEMKVQVWLDSPGFLKRFKRVYIDGKEFAVSSVREHKGFGIIKLEGVDSINDVMPFKEKVINVLSADAGLKKGEFFLQDLIGARVINDDGSEVGILKEIMESPASMIYIVEGEEEHLIPAVPEFILSTDAEDGIIHVRLIEGM